MNIPEQPKRKWPAGTEWQCEEIHMQHERERNAARMIQELLKKLAKAEQALAELKKPVTDEECRLNHKYWPSGASNVAETLNAVLSARLESE